MSSQNPEIYNALSQVALFLKERSEKEEVIRAYQKLQRDLEFTEDRYIKELNDLKQKNKDLRDTSSDYELRISNLKKKQHELYSDVDYYKNKLEESREKWRNSERSLEKTIDDLKYDVRSLKKKLRKFEEVEKSESSIQTDIDHFKRPLVNFPDYNSIINLQNIEKPSINLPDFSQTLPSINETLSTIDVPVQITSSTVQSVDNEVLDTVLPLDGISSLIGLLNSNQVDKLIIDKPFYNVEEENFGTQENPLWFYTVSVSGSKLLVLNETFRWFTESENTSLSSYIKQLKDSSIIKLSTVWSERKCSRLCISGQALIEIANKLMDKFPTYIDNFNIVLKALDKICWSFEIVKQ